MDLPNFMNYGFPDSMDYIVIKDLHVPWDLWIYLFPWIKNLLNSMAGLWTYRIPWIMDLQDSMDY